MYKDILQKLVNNLELFFLVKNYNNFITRGKMYSLVSVSIGQ